MSEELTELVEESNAAYGKYYEEKYHKLLALLIDTTRPHGLCEPRNRHACLHCNAQDEIDRIVSSYQVRPFVKSNGCAALAQHHGTDGEKQ